MIHVQVRGDNEGGLRNKKKIIPFQAEQGIPYLHLQDASET